MSHVAGLYQWILVDEIAAKLLLRTITPTAYVEVATNYIFRAIGDIPLSRCTSTDGPGERRVQKPRHDTKNLKNRGTVEDV